MSDRPFPAHEPKADIRAFAKAMRDLFIALQQEGFGAQEALVIVGQVIATGLGGSK